MSSAIAFILGAGPGVGKSVAVKLKANGYKVAVGSRRPNLEDAKKHGFFPVMVDVAKIETVSDAFHAVEKELGGPANVVIHNVSTNPSGNLPNPEDPLSLTFSEFDDSVKIGSNVFAVAQRALAGFRSQTSQEHSNVFITTGNVMPFKPAIPFFAALTAQKKISAHITELCAGAYAKEGFQFYFASQVNSEGELPGEEFDGEAHAVAYWDIVQRKEQARWDYRFTKDGSIFKNY